MLDIITGTITVIQPAPAEYVNGRYETTQGEKVENVPVNVQPMKPSEIAMLPEGRRNMETIKIYSELRLFVSDEKNNKTASIVEYNGKTYEIHMVFDWSNGTDIMHYKSFGIKVDGQGEGEQ